MLFYQGFFAWSPADSLARGLGRLSEETSREAASRVPQHWNIDSKNLSVAQMTHLESLFISLCFHAPVQPL